MTTRGEDIEAGRLLTGMTRAQLGRRAAVCERSVQRLELGDSVHPATAAAITRALHLDGVRFERPGIVRHVDGRLAPTWEAVGKLDGARLRRAAWSLGWTQYVLAGKAGLSASMIKRLLRGRRLNGAPSKPVWAAVGALQREGCVFGMRSDLGRSDRFPRRRVSIKAMKAQSDLSPSTMSSKLSVAGPAVAS